MFIINYDQNIKKENKYKYDWLIILNKQIILWNKALIDTVYI